ncbi:MAG: response regulator [Candidatus Sumerlaeota bacterium]|nr:response regulator [Candidatus Sumerlaeota bacterium]
MAGEHILVIDDSAATRGIARRALESRGYRVTTAGNAAAALLAPEFQQFNVVAMDADLEGIDGWRAARELKTAPDKSEVPILMLVQETAARERGSVEVGSADGYLMKPFSPESLADKIQSLLAQKQIAAQAQDILRAQAEKQIEAFANQRIKEALDKQIPIMADAMIQSVISKVEQRAKGEVDERIVSLLAKKEEELIEKTVNQVAQTVTADAVQAKVTEGVEAMLKDTVEKVVERTALHSLPALIRERTAETMDRLLPREIESRVQKAVDQIAPQISENLVMMVTSVTEKVVPRVARERLPEILDRQLEISAQKICPPLVEKLVPRALEKPLAEKIEPLVNTAVASIRQRTLGLTLLMAGLFLLFSLLMTWFACGVHDAARKNNPPSVSAPEGGK